MIINGKQSGRMTKIIEPIVSNNPKGYPVKILIDGKVKLFKTSYELIAAVKEQMPCLMKLSKPYPEIIKPIIKDKICLSGESK